MVHRYRFDPSRSHFTAQAFAAGFLSLLGHSPTFAVRDFGGTVAFEGGKASGMRLELTVRADSLALLDQVRDADRIEIEDTMRRKVLETEVYPEIAYRSAEVSTETLSPGQYRVRIAGQLSLHGVTRPHPLGVGLTVFDDGIRLLGESPLRLSDHVIRPVTALAGAIKLKDVLRVSFDVAAIPEGS
jgi:polyisoprenoid-binding protein YceI